MKPKYIFETSWEVCNRVGGIYTVLSSRANIMSSRYPDRVFFFGPDLKEQSDIFFSEQKTLLAPWRRQAAKQGLRVRVGRWQVPGKPVAVLVDFSSLWEQKDSIYAHVWELFGVRSHAAYGDYDESSLFGYAVGQAMESLHAWLCRNSEDASNPTICHFNEWQTAFGLFYIREHCTDIATVFTTHATGIGRSIAGNGKPLYDYFSGYHGDQMADELGMVSKHSAEKQAAHFAHCFTTVSEITARECEQLLERRIDVVTENGFEPDLVPQPRQFAARRREARQALLRVAQQAGANVTDDAVFCCISGRQEWKNKGIDVFLAAMQHLADSNCPSIKERQVVAFVMIPYLSLPVRHLGAVTVVFCPFYLNGDDPMFAKTYYDLLIGMDLTIFPSYYEPWGYTPHESIAFHVPTVTTDLAGFGLWAATRHENEAATSGGMKPVSIIHRTDSNEQTVIQEVANSVEQLSALNIFETEQLRERAAQLAQNATWEQFFCKYELAYEKAFQAVSQKNK